MRAQRDAGAQRPAWRTAIACASLGVSSVFAQETPAIPLPATVAVQPATAPRWAVQLPKADPVAFRGLENFDGAGVGSMPMVYPAPNAAGLLAAVIVHGLMNESAKNAQKTQLQQEADRVLLPYRVMLSGYTHAELASSVQAPADATGETWLVESAPVFALTQDQTALVLDNAVSVRRAGVKVPAAYESVIRVVSSPMSEPDPVTYWHRDNAALLREVAGSLMRESVELAVSMAAKNMPASATAPRTYRYLEGKTEKVERASLVSEHCPRRVLLTLRETLMSVPLGGDAQACAVETARSPVP